MEFLFLLSEGGRHRLSLLLLLLLCLRRRGGSSTAAVALTILILQRRCRTRLTPHHRARERDGRRFFLVEQGGFTDSGEILTRGGACDVREVGLDLSCGVGDVAGDETVGEPGVVGDVEEGRTFGGVWGKDGLDEGTDVAGDCGLGREFVFIVADTPVRQCNLVICSIVTTGGNGEKHTCR